MSKRVIDRGQDHAHLQLERLMPALRLAGESVVRGDLKAIAPLIKVIDRLDKHQATVVAKHYYGPEERERLLDKINRVAAISKSRTARGRFRRIRPLKTIPSSLPCNPLKRLDSDERIQGNPSLSNPA